jgi:LysR family transcriptional regulator, regulator for metE and metH
MPRIGDLPTSQLEVRDLRVVLALASAGTTAKAAALLHLTQSAVSRALLAVESRLDTRLFDRSARGLIPTAAGEVLLAGGARLLVELADLELRVRAPASVPRRIRLVCECYTAYHWLPTALVSWREVLPDLDVALVVEHTRDPIAALADGAIDIALVTSAPVPAPLEGRPLFADEIVFVMAASHPLAAQRTLTAADLRATTLITSPTPDGERRWFLSRVFGRTRPKLHFELLPLTEAILDVTRAGMGVAILSEWIAGPHLGRGDLVVRRLAKGALRRPWRLAWRPEVRDVIPRLRSALEKTVPHARLVA